MDVRTINDTGKQDFVTDEEYIVRIIIELCLELSAVSVFLLDGIQCFIEIDRGCSRALYVMVAPLSSFTRLSDNLGELSSEFDCVLWVVCNVNNSSAKSDIASSSHTSTELPSFPRMYLLPASKWLRAMLPALFLLAPGTELIVWAEYTWLWGVENCGSWPGGSDGKNTRENAWTSWFTHSSALIASVGGFTYELTGIYGFGLATTLAGDGFRMLVLELLWPSDLFVCTSLVEELTLSM